MTTQNAYPIPLDRLIEALWSEFHEEPQLYWIRLSYIVWYYKRHLWTSV